MTKGKLLTGFKVVILFGGLLMNIKRYKLAFSEFIRYVFVGGISFIVDFTVLYLSREIFLKDIPYSLYISTVIGFLAGMFVNYIFSIRFVFLSAKNMELGRSTMDKILFLLIGVIGLIISELGMGLGVEFLGINYLITKVIIVAIVMFWNYLARKKLIFNLDYAMES